jgi:adenylyl-sulfate kinase
MRASGAAVMSAQINAYADGACAGGVASIPVQRADVMGPRACCLWLTGLSGAGKSTLAEALDARLRDLGRQTAVLDGDTLRLGLNRDLGFDAASRTENIRRTAEVARLMVDAGLIVIVALISPFRDDRQLVRARFAAGEFLELFVDTPIEICERRDPKGLYKKARAGMIGDFTGVSSPYEPPLTPDMVLAAGSATPKALSELVVAALVTRGLAPR